MYIFIYKSGHLILPSKKRAPQQKTPRNRPGIVRSWFCWQENPPWGQVSSLHIVVQKIQTYMKGGFTNQSIHFSICVLKRVSLQLLFFQNTKKAQLCNSLINLINSTGAKLNFKKKTWTTPWNAPMASYRAVDPHGTDGRSDARRESSGSSLAVMKKRWVNTGKVWFFNTYIYIYIYSPSIFL